MIIVDTSALIDSLTGSESLSHRLRSLIESGERLLLPSVVLFEWLRGPRLPQELQLQEDLFPHDQILGFGPPEAAIAADLYRNVRRARNREIDLIIAATAIVHGAAVWTLNRDDFRDLPGVPLI